MQHTASKKKTGLFMRFVQLVEALGNRLPHPLYLYVVLIVLVLVISSLCASAGISATYEQVDPATGELTTVTVQAVDLLSRHSLQTILANWVNAYDANTVLPAIMAITMFVSIADRSGLFSAAMHRLLLVMGKSRWITTYVLALAGVCSTIMADAGVVLAVSLGAVVFKSVGRKPLAGHHGGVRGGLGGLLRQPLPRQYRRAEQYHHQLGLHPPGHRDQSPVQLLLQDCSRPSIVRRHRRGLRDLSGQAPGGHTPPPAAGRTRRCPSSPRRSGGACTSRASPF